MTTSRASSVCGDEHGSDAGDSVDADTLGAALAAAQVPYTVPSACGNDRMRSNSSSPMFCVVYDWQTYDALEPRPISSAKVRPHHTLGAHQPAPRLLHTATASAATGATALAGPTAACSPFWRCVASAQPLHSQFLHMSNPPEHHSTQQHVNCDKCCRGAQRNRTQASLPARDSSQWTGEPT